MPKLLPTSLSTSSRRPLPPSTRDPKPKAFARPTKLLAKCLRTMVRLCLLCESDHRQANCCQTGRKLISRPSASLTMIIGGHTLFSLIKADARITCSDTPSRTSSMSHDRTSTWHKIRALATWLKTEAPSTPRPTRLSRNRVVGSRGLSHWRRCPWLTKSLPQAFQQRLCQDNSQASSYRTISSSVRGSVEVR